jgi:hypothetical protein
MHGHKNLHDGDVPGSSIPDGELGCRVAEAGAVTGVPYNRNNGTAATSLKRKTPGSI